MPGDQNVTTLHHVEKRWMEFLRTTVPPQSEKYSFRMKVRAMSADELAQRCADEPAFKTALDALEQKT